MGRVEEGLEGRDEVSGKKDRMVVREVIVMMRRKRKVNGTR